MPKELSFTSKDAFKSITWAIKERLPKSVQIKDIRNAAAAFEGFPSASEYMHALDGQKADLEGYDKSLVHPDAPTVIEKIGKQEGMLPDYFEFRDNSVGKYPLFLYYTEKDKRYYSQIEFDFDSFYSVLSTTRYLNEAIGHKSFKSINDKLGLTLRSTLPMWYGFPKKGDFEKRAFESPYEKPEIIEILETPSGGSGVTFIQDLVRGLYNGYEWKVKMSNVANLDSNYFGFALEIIKWYKQYGESDDTFLFYGSQLTERARVNIAFNEGYELAQKFSQTSEYGDVRVSRTEFEEWEGDLLSRIKSGELDVDTSFHDEHLTDALMMGVDRYKEGVEDEDWR